MAKSTKHKGNGLVGGTTKNVVPNLAEAHRRARLGERLDIISESVSAIAHVHAGKKDPINIRVINELQDISEAVTKLRALAKTVV